MDSLGSHPLGGSQSKAAAIGRRAFSESRSGILGDAAVALKPAGSYCPANRQMGIVTGVCA